MKLPFSVFGVFAATLFFAVCVVPTVNGVWCDGVWITAVDHCGATPTPRQATYVPTRLSSLHVAGLSDTGTLTRTSVSPSACNQPGDSGYECAKAYSWKITGSSTGRTISGHNYVRSPITLTPTTTGQNCPTGTGSVSETRAQVSFSPNPQVGDWAFGSVASEYVMDTNGGERHYNIAVEFPPAGSLALLCTGTYQVSSGEFMSIQKSPEGPPAGSTTTGQLARTSVSPSAGAIVGIVVGSLLGLGLIIGTALFVMLKRKQKTNVEP